MTTEQKQQIRKGLKIVSREHQLGFVRWMIRIFKAGIAK